MTNVHFRPITNDNLSAILRLRVRPDQEKFVANNTYSLAQALFEPLAWYRAIYADETPVGFIMTEEDAEKGDYYLWRFMIDAAHQGKGYGSQALQLLVERIRRRPKAQELYLSYVPDEAGSPKSLYERIGFAETGEIDEGEVVMCLKFAAAEIPEAEVIRGTITHLVLFKLQDGSAEGRAAALQQLRTLDGAIPTLRTFSVGTDIIHSARSYDIGLVATFDDRAGLEAYQKHELHLPVIAYMQAHCHHIAAVDYEQ